MTTLLDLVDIVPLAASDPTEDAAPQWQLNIGALLPSVRPRREIHLWPLPADQSGPLSRQLAGASAITAVSRGIADLE